MTDINKVFLVGRLTRDAELKKLTNTSVCNFSLASNRSVKDNAGNWADEVSYFDVELFGRSADAIHKYLQKGKQIAVEGSLRQNRWEDQAGQKRSRVVVIANNVQLLGGSERGQGSSNSSDSGSRGDSYSPNVASDIDDDIPF